MSCIGKSKVCSKGAFQSIFTNSKGLIGSRIARAWSAFQSQAPMGQAKHMQDANVWLPALL